MVALVRDVGLRHGKNSRVFFLDTYRTYFSEVQRDVVEFGRGGIIQTRGDGGGAGGDSYSCVLDDRFAAPTYDEVGTRVGRVAPPQYPNLRPTPLHQIYKFLTLKHSRGFSARFSRSKTRSFAAFGRSSSVISISSSVYGIFNISEALPPP